MQGRLEKKQSLDSESGHDLRCAKIITCEVWKESG